MRRWRIALATGLLVAGLPAVAHALVYTFVATPLIVTQGEVTDFKFSFTNLDPQGVRCAEVLFPDEFLISSLGNPVASSGLPWSTSLSGQWVLVYTNGGGGRLRTGESVTFTVTAVATTPGAYIFDNHVHVRQDCTGTNLTGTTVPLTVLPAATPTPSATPSPKPIATASPRPTPDPMPDPTPDRASPTPTETPQQTARPDPSARPSVAGPSPSPDATDAAQIIRVAPSGGGDGGVTDDVGVGVDILALLDSPFEWFVPGAAVGVPGLLVVLFVGLQAVGALAWIPAVRRMGDDDDRRRRGTRSRHA